MIYTLTFNPALDYIVKVDDFRQGEVNRTVEENIFGGGKGINVSLVLQNLGVPNVMLGFTAGFTGEEIERRVHARGCRTDFIRLENGWSRINFKLRSAQESEINGKGPDIPPDKLEELYRKLDTLHAGDILVISGSIPSSLPDDVYERIMARLQPKRIEIVVDATRKLLLNAMQYRPFLVKPNKAELGEMFHTVLHTNDEVVERAQELQELGGRNILVSMAGEGAVLLAEDGKVYHSLPPEGKVVNSVGAGDSMVAGFLAGWLKTGEMKEAFRMGLAAGSASAFSMELATAEAVEGLLKTF